MRPYISFSEMMLYRNECQFRWKLDFVDGKRMRAYGVHLDFGTAIHGAVERHRTRKDPVSVEEAVKVFEESFTASWDKNHEKYSDRDKQVSREEFLAAGKNILVHFHECGELAEAEVIYNEHELFLPIDRSDEIQIKFKGFIDMVIKTKDKRGNSILYVIDFKTCSWGWGREKREDKNLHFQIFLYKHFLCKKFNLDNKLVRCAFVLLKKKPKKGDSPIEFFPVSAGPVSVQRSLNVLNETITDMGQRLQNDTLQKNRNSCINKFGQTCPHYKTENCP